MPVYKCEALILRTYKLGEADRIVVFLTRDRGKKRGVAKGARRPRSPFTGGLEPMTRADVQYYEREQRDLPGMRRHVRGRRGDAAPGRFVCMPALCAGEQRNDNRPRGVDVPEGRGQR